MNEITLLQFVHLLGLVYWLGGDLGVFYSSSYVADENNSPETRVKIAKILFALDQAPRICMTLMLPTGYHLAHAMGLVQLPIGTVWLVWLLGLAWMAMVITLHLRHGADQWLARIDYVFRIVLIVALLAIAVTSLRGSGWLLTSWLPFKLIIFAVLIFFGLMIRRRLVPFGPAFGRLVQGDVDEQVNVTIRRSLASVKPWVIGIWLGLLVNTALGIHLIQP